ncbi:TPA: restriction endonuclease subunit S, partial [Campylobacter coli]|nr:restriction endonuclease subunit S [Campylobacter coli]
MNNWKKCKLGDICSKITDGSHKSPPSQTSGFPMASVKDMEYNQINLNTCRKISKEDYLELVASGCQPEINDILIAKDGSYLKHVFRVRK